MVYLRAAQHGDMMLAGGGGNALTCGILYRAAEVS